MRHSRLIRVGIVFQSSGLHVRYVGAPMAGRLPISLVEVGLAFPRDSGASREVG